MKTPPLRPSLPVLLIAVLLCLPITHVYAEIDESAGPSPERSPYEVTLWNPQQGEDSDALWSQTWLMAGLGVGVAGFIALLPEEISNWERDDDDDGLLKQWWDNVSDGPVWDNDVWYINYVGHPYFGGVYYQVARKAGYNQWNSFVYSTLMSTFYWEYGLEAFAETPSIQDLFITPIGGWIYGEWAYHKEQEIVANGGIVWGSKGWGNTMLFLLDPVGVIGDGINHMVGRQWINTGSGMVSTYPQYFDQVAGAPPPKDYVGLDMVFTF